MLTKKELIKLRKVLKASNMPMSTKAMAFRFEIERKLTIMIEQGEMR